jgi:copper chaperone CopZ
MDILLKIDGMHCGGCSQAVRRALLSVPSVSAVTVDLGAGRATVEANSAVDRDRLVSAVVDAGYEARIEARP